MMNKEQQENFAKIFAILDSEGRGTISRDQVAKGIRLLNGNPTDEEIQIHLDNSGKQVFTHDDFMSCIRNTISSKSLQERKEDLREAFTVFDKANSGWLEKEIFVDILTKYGHMRMDENDTRTWIERLDRRKDGKIRIAELEELFLSDEDVLAAIDNQRWDSV